MLDAVRTLELANKAHSLYLAQPPTEIAKLLKVVLSICAIDAASVYPTHRKTLRRALPAGEKRRVVRQVRLELRNPLHKRQVP